ncbi:spore germination protein [Shimazuella sp. AN120528]|uniref:spore germination protein n=1 Tax=Shimazuella soli TaxID=1892854 RepID=UPI001F0FCAB8|nr:spore germination protein [Shimazuella soli]MCH5584267.1 spore germination protein [Shimazuella soli]
MMETNPSNTQDNNQNSNPVSSDIMVNIEYISNRFSHSPDLIIRSFQTKGEENVALVFFSCLNDKASINEDLLRPLMFHLDSISEIFQPEIPLPIGSVQKLNSWVDIEKAMFRGESILFIDNVSHALAFCTQGWPQRAIAEPQIESSLKGGHQGFVETLEINLALIRRYVTDDNLVVKEHSVGKRAPTKVYILYIEDVVNPDYVQEVTNRIQNIKKDAVLDLGELEEMIEDDPLTVFPQFLISERPDNIASNLLQGRVAILMDHSPNAIVAPMTLAAFFQSQDDYSSRWIVATFLRLLRVTAFFLAIILPSLYIAVISFHYEVIPLDLMLSVGESRSRVPFPPILEAILMEIAIEMLREAGLRLPNPIGQTVGVVGGIVVGEAAVQAGIVSNIMVIVVSVTAIAGFIIPNYDMSSAIRLVRFPVMIISALFGIVGLSVGLMVLFAHLISLKSLGVPFGSPIAPIHLIDWKDVFVRVPLNWMKKRPFSVNPQQSRRLGEEKE